MRIEGWHVDGFGILHDYEVAGLDGGVTVLLGDNEAGKSTLLAFLRAILFGFPSGNTKERKYPPLRGGSHGGEVMLRDDAGILWTVERHKERRAVAVSRSDGRECSEADLRDLLGGMDAPLFKSLCTFSLSELQRFEDLKAHSVRDRIFVAGVTGAGRSPRDATEAFAADMKDLLKQAAGKGEINKLVDDMTDLAGRIREARQLAGRYGELLDTERSKGGQVADAKEVLDGLRERRNEIQRLTEVHAQFKELQELRAELLALPGGDNPGLAARATALESDLERQLAREESVARQTATRDEALSQVTASAERLGAGWTVERVREFDTSIPRRDEVETHLSNLDRARDDLQEKRREHARLQNNALELAAGLRRLQKQLPETQPPSQASIDERQGRLAGLRVDVEKCETAAREAQQVSPTPGIGPRFVVLAAVIVGILAAAGVAALLVSSDLGLGMLVGAAAAAVVAVAAYASSRRSGSSATAKDEAVAAAAAMRQNVSQTAQELGVCTDLPTTGEVLGFEARLREEQRQRDAWTVAQEAVREAARKVDDVEDRVRAAKQHLLEAEKASRRDEAHWSDWKAAHGAADQDTLSPNGMLEVMGEVDKAVAADGLARTAQSALDGILATAEAWEASARRLLEAAGVSHTEMDTAAIRAACGTLAGQLARRAQAEIDVGRLEALLATRLGTGDEGAERWRELKRGDVGTWNEELATLAGRVQEADRQHDEAIQQETLARRDREALEESADLEVLLAEMASKRAELAELVHRYRVAATARELIQLTQNKYVRERQPAVLKRASGDFSTITGGRYVSIRQDTDQTDDLVAVSGSGAVRSLDVLSDGTQQQLYLVMRLSLVADFASRRTPSEPLPIVMDDCLVNFDETRARVMAHVLNDWASDGQCVLLTCHAPTSELLREVAGEAVTVVRMEVAGPAGLW